MYIYIFVCTGLVKIDLDCRQMFGNVLAMEGLESSVFSYYRMCSLTIECVLFLWNVLSYYRMCSLTIECVLLL